MVTDDLFGENPRFYSRIRPLAQMEENVWTNGAYPMDLMEEALFKFPPLTPSENSWYSISSEEYSYTDRFYEISNQQSVNSSLPSVQTPAGNSAFTAYVRADPKAELCFSPGGHILHKRCFRFFSLIRGGSDSGTQMSSVAAVASKQQSRIDFRNKLAFEHMVAERNRRIRLKQHFENLYSLLPKQSKRDKYSILTNTASYLKDLKLRLADLEQENQNLLKLIPENAMDRETSFRFESHQQQSNSEGKLFYQSDEVALEHCEDNPWQVKISIRAHRDLIRCPTALLSKLLEQLSAEQLQLVSIHSPIQALWFEATILIEPKGERWNASRWKKIGEVVRHLVASNDNQMNLGITFEGD